MVGVSLPLVAWPLPLPLCDGSVAWPFVAPFVAWLVREDGLHELTVLVGDERYGGAGAANRSEGTTHDGSKL